MAESALRAAQDAIAGLAGGLGLDTGPAASPAASDPAFEEAMKKAMEEEAAVAAAKKAPPAGATPMTLPALTASLSPAQQKAIELLADVNLDVKIELGRTRMLVEDVLKLGEGAVVELDKLAGDPVDIFVNNRHVARGEVLVLNDSFCVRVSEILQQVSDPATMVAKPA
jgi:flagellar motor switch protein FliN/FliY